MRITSSVEYAARLMVSLARVHGQTPLSAEKLSEAENIPVGYINQLFLRLKRAGLVRSQRGLRGGYFLAQPPSEVTLGQVARAVEGPIFESVCDKYDHGQKDCHRQTHCGISPVWRRLGSLIEDYFDGITLAQILEEKSPCDGVELMLGGVSGRSEGAHGNG
ncbi:MAG: Rrf2 family transcriptional regulator [Elusimicrobia bacterium]|nr:Rrf2 family transcriptional regulator [Elusimicrobiota bacterium]